MTGKWEVVKKNKRSEQVLGDGLTWSEAYAIYEKAAETVNAADKDGNYKFLNDRISIRETH